MPCCRLFPSWADNWRTSYLINAVNTRDYPVAQSSVVFLSILFSLIVLATDLCYAAVDPMIRAQFTQGGKKKKKGKEENA